MLTKTATLFALTLAASLTAHADFSYTTTQKTTGGSMGAMMGATGDRTLKFYLKGQKMMTSTGDIDIIVDFGAQTITNVNNAKKTYTVKKFGDAAAGEANTDVTMDVKETGQKKNVNGFNASEMLVTMNMDMDTGRGPAMKMQLELDMWISPDVPGAGELRDFYRKNAANFPWRAMTGGAANPSMQKAMAQMQRAMTEINGVVVEQVMRMKPAAGSQAQMPQMPQMTPAQMAQMQAAIAKMGPNSPAAQQMQQMMNGMGRGAASGSASGAGSLIEMTADSSGFSSAAVPESVFAIPAGYTQAQ
jgi:hypothetical protein